ncbi:mono-functional DNA-alkylating methyl methanesulfonate N-term-domain-containing protein [Mycena alexandri]|uniref:Mono-functional DNA-alkylating methyl methanesulfonate N-term-domain-containing protein n=1 Tax=Mycena alexandri TaxID=1745969 RepID=A0AAD6X994_9AGAR|nr:mono-functional DNA-alkylating methyl methanesulfonate N-term-domain-containing protein [Mycena alexandri]
MKIVSTFHQPSSVLSSLKCQLTSTGVEHLVVAKLDGIEVYSVEPEGLKHQCRWNVWGNVLAVKSVPTKHASRSTLIVMLDHPEPELIFLTYEQLPGADGKLSITHRLELVERNSNQRPAEFFNDLLVHPDGNLALVSCYCGKLKLVALSEGNFVSASDASLMELVVLSIAFLPSRDECSIAILHQDHAHRVQLHARTVFELENSSDYDISPDLSTVLHFTPISSKTLPYPAEAVPKLIPVPCPRDTDADLEESDSFIGGVLLVGGTRILLFEVVSAEGQLKQKNKRRKLEREKTSGKKADIEKASKKEDERNSRKRKPKAFVDWPWSEITSWCAVDGEPFRYLIGDSFGRLSMLSLHDVPNNGLVLIPLGQTSPPMTLTYLANQILYVGSHAGDSQLVAISSTPLSSSDEPTLPIPPEITTVVAARLAPPSVKGKGREDHAKTLRDCVLDVKGPFVRVIDTFKNVAPILDATLVDIEKSGHPQIVTCSGGQNTGSIHVMRKGSDFQQLATVSSMPHTIGLFTLRRTYDDIFDSHVLVSTLQKTQAFQIETRSDTFDATGDFANERTLAASNIKRVIVQEAKRRGNTIVSPARNEYAGTPLVVQVTSTGAFLLEFDMVAFSKVDDYDVANRGNSAELRVVAASINASQTVLALNSGRLLCLEVDEKNRLNLKWESRVAGQVSALSCMPLDSSQNASELIVVAYWQTNDIEILRQVDGNLTSVCKTQSLSAVVRSLLLYDFGVDCDSHPHLLAGLADGSFVSFTWDEEKGALGEPNLASLGNLPVSLTPCVVDGKRALFAAGSRAMVLLWERDSIHHSPVILKEVAAAAQLHHEKYESSLILANDSALFIGHVRKVDEMHIRSIPLGLDAPQRIVYEPSLKVFGVACTRQEPTRVGTTEPTPKSSFRLLDDTGFSNLSQYNCNPDEEITCVTSLTLDQNGVPTPFFFVGTYVVKPDEDIPTSGRLIVFSTGKQPSPELSLFASRGLPGCIYTIAKMNNNMIAIGVDSAVMVLTLSTDVGLLPEVRLSSRAEINLNYFVTSLAVYENRLVVGDQISSVSLLELRDSRLLPGNSELHQLAKDLTPLSPVSVQALSTKHIIAANDTLNLLSFTLDEANRKLDCDGYYHEADLINKFVPGAITAADPGSKLEPVQLYFTSSGRIGIIIDIIDQQLGLDLTNLQRNMISALPTAGDSERYTRFRAPQSALRQQRREHANAFGFLDGGFLERLLVTPPGQLAKIVEGTSEPERLERPIQEFQQLLKTLQALH